MRRFGIMPEALYMGKASLLQAIIFAFVLCLIITPFVRRLSLRARILDVPRDERRMHKSAVPLAGGAGIIAAFLLSLALFCGGARFACPLAVFCILCGAYGVIDDKLALPVWLKLAFQLAVAFAATPFLARAEAFSFFGYTVYLGALSAPATALWGVFMMNAVNLTDGMDGLCAGTSAVSAACLSVLLFLRGESAYALAAAALSGACLGFLFHNSAPAKIFMGETGSAFLGFALAFLAMPLFSADAQAPLASVLPAFLFPLCEAASSFLRRAAKGKSPFAPDKSHMHHVMFARGFSVPMVCAVAFTFSLLCALCSLLYGSQRAAALLLFSLAVLLMRLALARKA